MKTPKPQPPTSKQPRKAPLPAIIRKSLLVLLYLLPAVLFFSYYPVISLGATPSMNLELSLPLIWLVLFDLAAFIALLTLPKTLPEPLPGTSPTTPPSTPPKPSKTLPESKSQPPEPSPKPKTRLTFDLPGISDRRIFLFSLLPFYLTLSVFWSPNPLRGLLTAGIAWLLFFAIFAIIFILPLTLKSPESPQPSAAPKNLKSHLLLSLFISTAAVCVFCFVQSLLDICGLSRSETLLCAGCTYRSFGFPHPSGFAIEPQFMGNLLLAPTLTALYLLTFDNDTIDSAKKRRSGTRSSSDRSELTSEKERTTPATAGWRDACPKSSFCRSRLFWLIPLLFATTLFFTFSRGAIYAFAVALLILLVFALLRRQFRPSLIIIPVAAFLLSLGLQGTFAALGPTSETFTSAVTKSLHHLSLGLIDLRPLTPNCGKNVQNSSIPVDNSPQNVQNSPENCGNSVENPTKPVEETTKTVDNPVENPEENSHDNTPEPPIFAGYVPESTDIRLNLNSIALATALRSPATLIFGVGLGGAGTAMHAAYPAEVTSPKEIVQNEPVSLLLETGLVGIALAIFTLLIAFRPQLFSPKFLDGRAAHTASRSTPAIPSKSLKTPSLVPKSSAKTLAIAFKTSPSPKSSFWSHPALPLLAALILAYFVTLNFFSGLPNALQIYLMPPLLFLIFRPRRP